MHLPRPGQKSPILLALLIPLLIAATTSATTHNINQSGLSFSPAGLTVAVGDTVRWIWTSGIHTVTNGTGSTDPQAGSLFDASFTSANPLVTHVFTEVGVVPYFCRPHFGLGMTGTVTVEAASAVNDIPAGRPALLRQNVPNPFNPQTRIAFDLPAAAVVELTVHDVSGRLVRTLLAGSELAKGVHEINWNGRSDLNAPVAAGVYFYTLRTPTSAVSKRMTLVK